MQPLEIARDAIWGAGRVSGWVQELTDRYGEYARLFVALGRVAHTDVELAIAKAGERVFTQMREQEERERDHEAVYGWSR